MDAYDTIIKRLKVSLDFEFATTLEKEIKKGNN